MLVPIIKNLPAYLMFLLINLVVNVMWDDIEMIIFPTLVVKSENEPNHSDIIASNSSFTPSKNCRFMP